MTCVTVCLRDTTGVLLGFFGESSAYNYMLYVYVCLSELIQLLKRSSAHTMFCAVKMTCLNL